MSWRTRGTFFPAGTPCDKCGAGRRGGRRPAAAIAECDECAAHVCEAHSWWTGSGYLCLPHARAKGIRVKVR